MTFPDYDFPAIRRVTFVDRITAVRFLFRLKPLRAQYDVMFVFKDSALVEDFTGSTDEVVAWIRERRPDIEERTIWRILAFVKRRPVW